MTSAHPPGVTLVLVGPPGAGKSTVGARVAERLGLTFTDTDQLLADRGGADVGTLMVDLGEEAFRELEADVVAHALDGRDVVALGSGAVASARDRLTALAAAGTAVVFLDVSLSAGAPRVGLNVPRPVALGSARAQLAAMAQERRPLYAAVATRTVDTSERDVESVVDEVAQILDPRQSRDVP
ncbi:shikimate kinase [Georgenia alba]|uniref:Shikimate kinase n=1 Tax=Georgenia alba TaxID=2233858 RepID=A0ABW2Q9J0_9MICO